GRSVGHEWAVFMATSGHFYWPPVGSSDWPLTSSLRCVTVDALWRRSVIALWRSFPTSFTSMSEMAREDRDIKREQL
ncbi:hypothetical protein RCH16_003678, partial [Cryobacterium sp. MP_M5]|uniref:hypothetical protein n=1 Tax=unclassified Cryobacterium TaxID=2649013 RepID=UPI001E31F776